MNNFKCLDLYKKSPIVFLAILLTISIASALFMPAMFTFTFGLPLLILFLLKQRLTWVGFWTAIAVIALSVFLVIGFAIYWVFLFTPFIHSFPTFVVLILTLLLMHLIPVKVHLVYKIIVFLFLSTLIGLNTKIIELIKPKHFIEQKINGILTLKNSDVVKITGNTLEIASSYNPYDFISFNSNEGVGGFWVYPKSESVNIAEQLQQREISYTQKNDSPYTLSIIYSKNIDEHIVNIQLKSNSKLLSSLKIVDRLPYQSSIDTEELDNFNLRLEYLLRHNIWNELIFLFTINSNSNNSSVINDFLDKSIKYNAKHVDWNKNTFFIEGKLIKSEAKGDCSVYGSNDYKNYVFNQWKDQSSDKSARIISRNIFSFEANNTIHSTKFLSVYSNKIQAYNEILWNEYDFSYPSENDIYAFYTFRLTKYIRIVQFKKTGQFVREMYVALPKNVVLDGRDWHPISHIELVDNKMRFRIYNIYEFNTKSEAAAPIPDQCSFNQLEINLP